jgi:putative PIN family toxin of toxin-antitoxin system
MKVVIDTSVWISALVKKESAARDLLRLALSGKLSPQMGEALFREYEAVMKRKKIQKMTPLSMEEQEQLLNAFLSVCAWRDIYDIWRPNLSDENDNFLVELAVASGAKAIITYNVKDFANAELVFKHKVTTPEDFLKEIS